MAAEMLHGGPFDLAATQYVLQGLAGGQCPYGWVFLVELQAVVGVDVEMAGVTGAGGHDVEGFAGGLGGDEGAFGVDGGALGAVSGAGVGEVDVAGDVARFEADASVVGEVFSGE
ncbi:MAG: hypothetical protein ACRDYU_13935 [Actinomycetes bacterium]